ncbi:MAG: ABC transporter ATP-binding protein [Phototrophicaceae bacterium]
MQTTMQKDKPAKRKRSQDMSLRRAIGYLGNQKRTAIYAYGALIVATLAQLAVPKLVQNMIDTITNGYTANAILDLPQAFQLGAATLLGQSIDELTVTQANSLSWLINGALIIILFAVVRGLFSFAQAYFAETTSQGVAYDFRNELFSKLQRLSFSYYDQNQTGQLMIRATDDVEKVRIFIAQGLILATQAFLLFVLTLVILFWTNWQLTLVVLPILPLALILFMGFGNLARPLFSEIQRRLSMLNTVLQEALAGIKVVKAFNREEYEQARFDERVDFFFEQQVKVQKVFSILFPTIFTLAQIGTALILYFGGRQIVTGTLTIGQYQEFTLYLVYIFFPLGQLGFIISLMAQAQASARRIFEIVDAKSDVENKPNAIDLPAIEGRVEFDNVRFSYFESSDDVLTNVNFVAEPGETIALLGSTGSGKTTVINLIPRFYDVREGAVKIDGYDVRDVTLDSLRSQIGIVLQETNLFSGTIRDNVAFGRPDASMEEVEVAAKAAAAHDFIKGFPEGYDTPVGERGTTLSGGQKQRIAIARALLLDPKLLILDDSTSSVDLVTEHKIQKALDNLMEGRTSFVIAQRISTVVNADKIVVLDKGKIHAVGKHQDLMETSHIYADIYNSQLVDDAEIEMEG